MIHHVSGKLGSGKTMFCVQQIVDWILAGKMVVTNVRLVDGWDYILTKHKMGGMGSFIHYMKSDFVRQVDFQIALATRYVQKYQYCSDITEAAEYAMKLGSSAEASRIFIFDEAQIFINSRMWKSTSQRIVEFFTQSRKLGFEVYLVSQDRDSVDRQIRVLADFHYNLKNMANIKPLGIRIFPRMGLLIKRHPDSQTLQGVNFISYSDWITKMYDTQQLLSVRMAPPTPWSTHFVKEHPWVSGCKARYEYGNCRFREIAKDQEFRFISDQVAPLMQHGQFVGDMPLITDPELVEEMTPQGKVVNIDQRR